GAGADRGHRGAHYVGVGHRPVPPAARASARREFQRTLRPRAESTERPVAAQSATMSGLGRSPSAPSGGLSGRRRRPAAAVRSPAARRRIDPPLGPGSTERAPTARAPSPPEAAAAPPRRAPRPSP